MIKRNIESKIVHWLGREKILVIKGPRQVGKTTLLRKIYDDLQKKGETVFFFSVDQAFHSSLFSDPVFFAKYLEDQIENKTGKMSYVFLDEFQYIKKAGMFLKVLFDQFKTSIQFIVSGSSALEITHNSEFLTGRKIEFLMSSLCFYEFVGFRSSYAYTQRFSLNDFSSLKKFYDVYCRDLELLFLEYLNYGGYPEICISQRKTDKKAILRELVTTYLEKDVSGFLRVGNVGAFNRLILLLSSQVGNLVNRSELTNTLRINRATLDHYLDLLVGTYVFDFVRPFFTNIRKESIKMPKVYINDLGILFVVLNKAEVFDFVLVEGGVVENFVYNELKHRAFDGLHFYRTVSKAEIDFVVSHQGQRLPVEVKFRSGVSKQPQIMRTFSDKYAKGGANIILTKDYLHQEGSVYFIPTCLLGVLDFKL